MLVMTLSTIRKQDQNFVTLAHTDPGRMYVVTLLEARPRGSSARFPTMDLVCHRGHCHNLICIADCGCFAVLDVTSPDLACNQGGETPAGLVADINAGESMTVTMNRVRLIYPWK